VGDATATTEPAAGEEPSSFARGASFGRYVVLAEVGAGGMGVIFACYDPKLDRRVALKRVRAVSGKHASERRERLLREAQALARLSHPNVIAVHDVGEHEERQETEPTEPLLVEALAVNARLRDDAGAARAVLALLMARAMRGNRVDEALSLLPIAEAYVQRAGDSPRLRAELELGRSLALMHKSRLAEARTAAE
jgi:hypothetical protein